MPTSYRVNLDDGTGFAYGDRPETIQDMLGRETHWPVGSYEITRAESPFVFPGARWGVAIKHPDGSVELIPDQSA